MIDNARPLVEHAIAYARTGLEVFPAQPADKRPMDGSHGFYDGTTDTATITGWWREHPGALIACRIPADVVVLDIDPRHGGDRTWQALLDHYGHVEPARSHISGRGDGGHHDWWQRPPGKLTAKGLHEFARTNGTGHAAGPRSWVSGIDLLHHDWRYTILPPSPHPDTGAPYRWRASDPPGEMPGWLAHYLTTPPTPQPSQGLPIAPRQADSVADWYSATTSWVDILTPAGWMLVAGDGDSDGSLWRHPNASAAHSASIKHGCLFVYTPNTPLEESEEGAPHGYTRFRAWAELDHGGDLQAAARHARDLRDGPIVQPATLGAPTSAPPIEAADPDEPESDWARIDLVQIARELRDGTRQREIPTVVAVEGAFPLFYRGRVNQLHGASGDGKSWVALLACVETVKSGELAMFVDWEDNPDGVTARLLALSCSDDEIALLDYRNPSSGLGSTLAFEGLAGCQEQPYTVVVVDSTGEAMAAGGVDGNVDAEVAAWFRHAKTISRWPSLPAVILIDHIPKATDAPAGAIGSQRKTAAITGASYRTTQTKAFAIGRSGIIRLSVLKDRLGHRAKGLTACEAHVDDTPTGLTIVCRLSEAQEAAEKGEKWRPTILMERVSTWLELYPGASKNAIETSVEGKASTVRDALRALIEDGFVAVELGERGAHLHRVVTPFRDDSSHLVPPRPTSSPPRPGRGQGQANDLVPLVPPLSGGRGTRSPDVGKDELAESTSSRPDNTSTSSQVLDPSWEDFLHG